jgi:TldD protein
MNEMVDFALDLALKKGARYAEVRSIESSASGFLLRNGNLDESALEESEGLSVRVLTKGFGFASTSAMSKEAVERTVERALKGGSAQKENIEMQECVGETFHERKSAGAEGVFDRLKSFDSELDCPMRIMSFSHTTEAKTYRNSDGADIRTVLPRSLFFVLLTVGDESTGYEQLMNEYGGVGGEEILNGMEEEIVKEKDGVLKCLKEKNRPPKGRVDYVVGPKISGLAAHESCGHPFEADRILGREMAQAGGSFLKGTEIGQRIGSDSASVIDDPTIEGSFGYYRYDDEGVKARKRYLIKKGIVNEFLQNRETAVMMNAQSNGSARASAYDMEPIVRMANTYIEPGDHSLEELIEGIEKGILMENYMEWNIDDKRLNQKYTACEAYLIENGEIKSTLYRPKLEVTTQGFYSAIDACSKDLRFSAATCGKGEPMQAMPVFTGGPYVRLRGVANEY